MKEPWYLDEYTGYAGPDRGIPSCLDPSSQLVTWPKPELAPRLVVIDDTGNGFRRVPALFPPCRAESLVIYKVHRPLTRGDLWKRVEGASSGSSSGENLVVVVSVNDLRTLPEVNISSGLSWERTARELLSQIRLNPYLEHLGRCRNLLVVLDTDEVFIYHSGPRPLARLVFDPKRWEGGFRTETKRSVVGWTNAFTAALAAQIYRNEGRLENLHEAAKAGLVAARRMLVAGYRGTSPSIRIPLENVFNLSDQSIFKLGDTSILKGKVTCDSFASVVVPASTSLPDPDPDYWRILETRTRNIRMRVAESLVRKGRHPVMEEVPELKIGGLSTSDRSEIESFSAVRKLLWEYLNGEDQQPLSIAVFGAPGAGKSFGVKQIAQSIGISKEAIGALNLSQLGPTEGLNSAFHRIRDIGLAGEVPLFFFDEFDSRNLDWLKLFLAPMQDGEFEDRGVNYHLGRCILVFAGGTSTTFEAFAERQEECKAQKLPDFISRLRGFINIMGPNPRRLADEGAAADPCKRESVNEQGKTAQDSAAENEESGAQTRSTAGTSAFQKTPAEMVADALGAELNDPGYVIRRAKLWRTLIMKAPQTPELRHNATR
ncbi:MAG: hypothetical protein EHM23_10300 [Acidobacteria bacterium]|nr:MAG: hypothetical protein EHM23_10300 [Acidobacteriota bacterium]